MQSRFSYGPKIFSNDDSLKITVCISYVRVWSLKRDMEGGAQMTLGLQCISTNLVAVHIHKCKHSPCFIDRHNCCGCKKLIAACVKSFPLRFWSVHVLLITAISITITSTIFFIVWRCSVSGPYQLKPHYLPYFCQSDDILARNHATNGAQNTVGVISVINNMSVTYQTS